MSVCYCYLRVSAVESDRDRARHRAEMEVYFRAKLEPAGYRWGGVGEEGPGSSGVPFWQRAVGGALFGRVERGDVVLVNDMLHCCRGVGDAVTLNRFLAAKGVALHLLDLGLDGTDSPALKVVAALADMQSARNAETARRRMATRKARGTALNGSPPTLYRYRGKKGRRRLALDPVQRDHARAFLKLHESGWSLDAVWRWTLLNKGYRAGNKEYSRSAVWRAIRAELRLRREERGGPTVQG